MRRLVLLGSTGSIGTQTLEVLAEHRDRFEVAALAAGGSDPGALIDQARRWAVPLIGVADPESARVVREALPEVEVVDGPQAATVLAGAPADLVVNAVTGAIGLAPTLAALEHGTPVALANKESLIVGGTLVTDAAERCGGREQALIPVDSEHSALAQCLWAGRRDEVQRLVLTASGGPFRGADRDELAGVTPASALAHPTWVMGPVITINSATLVNKGLEVLEAQLLFEVPFERIDVVVHPQSVVHSMVEFVDGATIAQLSPPDMRLPIQLALQWPNRLAHAPSRCDWTVASTLTFEPVDRSSFPALDLAEAAGRAGGSQPAVYNAANEVAVAAFLDERLRFLDIPRVIEGALERSDPAARRRPQDLDDVLEVDRSTRRLAGSLVEEVACR